MLMGALTFARRHRDELFHHFLQVNIRVSTADSTAKFLRRDPKGAILAIARAPRMRRASRYTARHAHHGSAGRCLRSGFAGLRTEGSAGPSRCATSPQANRHRQTGRAGRTPEHLAASTGDGSERRASERRRCGRQRQSACCATVPATIAPMNHPRHWHERT